MFGLGHEPMTKTPAIRAFARKSVDSLVKKYKQASLKALCTPSTGTGERGRLTGRLQASSFLRPVRAHGGNQSPWAAMRSSTRFQIWSRSSSAAVCGSIIAAW